ncbi:MAG TPA: OmpA family protein [Steroidobacteraceae bacterium]|nr:OmpA family protein [Steroidobacteraceae bacterium]
MNTNARTVHRLAGFGAACAIAAALPCMAGPAPQKVEHKTAPAEENIGLVSGLAVGAAAGGPVGAVAGAITGALLGEHYHKQKVANGKLAADLSGSNADKAQLAAALEHARELTVTIGFRTGDANLGAEDIDRLTTLGQLAGAMAGVTMQVSGYADPRGSPQYNLALSKDRAESVAAVLMNAGVDKDHIVIEALGAQGATPSGNLDDYAFERRVSVKLVGAPAVAAEVIAPAATRVAQAE